jgi:hypothetical protein
VNSLITSLVEKTAAPGWSNSLGAKLVQLTMPGVPDVYQGSELWETSLVDPDNRRPVDFAARKQGLVDLAFGALPQIDEGGLAKLLVVSRALRLRRDRPELFSEYRTSSPLTAAARSPPSPVSRWDWSGPAGGGIPPSYFRKGPTAARSPGPALKAGRFRQGDCLKPTLWHFS